MFMDLFMALLLYARWSLYHYARNITLSRRDMWNRKEELTFMTCAGYRDSRSSVGVSAMLNLDCQLG